MSDATRILAAIEKGDAHASDELLPIVYEELRRLAGLPKKHRYVGGDSIGRSEVEVPVPVEVGCGDRVWVASCGK